MAQSRFQYKRTSREVDIAQKGFDNILKRIKNTKAELWDQQKLSDAKEKDNVKLEAVIN